MKGYLLAGGRSRRMGREKALVPVLGEPMAHHVARTLAAAGFGPVHLVGPASVAEALGLVAVADQWPGEGPLGAIITALRHADGDGAVVVACDMPLLDPNDVRALRRHAGTSAAVAASRGRLNPVLAAYPHAALAPLEQAFAAGERSPAAALARLDLVEVPVPADRCRSLDTPELVGSVRAEDVPGWTGHVGGHRGAPAMTDAHDVPEIDVEALAELHDQGATVLDVRQPEEYEEAHVPGAVLIPLDQLPDRLHEVPDASPLPVICKSGGRSRVAAELLRGHGRQAVNVAGGTLAWIEAGYDTESGA